MGGCAAAPECTANAPGCGRCAAPMADCNADLKDGCETNIDVAPEHCGQCGKVCPGLLQKTALCVRGECASCDAGTLDCDGRGDNGCEQNVVTDADNCGGCGQKCAAPQNGTAACVLGKCVIGFCAKGFQDCDGIASTGCELDVRADKMNCGACGRVCPAPAGATVTCEAGECRLICANGTASCGAQLNCETRTTDDVYHCGACNKLCPAVSGMTRACVTSVCTGVACDPTGRWRNCNGNLASDGCEADTFLDPQNCGGCGTVCTYANGVAACANSLCVLAACREGFGSCDNSAANGCETPLANNNAHCGACNKACAADRQCVDGKCI